MGSRATDPVRIQLCLEGSSQKYQALLHDLLELQLLLQPHVETVACKGQAQDKTYIFRQSAKEIEHGKEEKSRLEVVSALYGSNKNAIFSQLEFLKQPSRNTMNERARTLADVLLKAISQNRKIADPFLLLSKKTDLANSDDVIDQVAQVRAFSMGKSLCHRFMQVF
jgi:hypothetical protein